jgi:predicted nucleic acid-binding protein
MANYIVDASVVIEYLITGSNTANVQAFFDQIIAADRLIAPEFCLLECTNVIWKQVRFNSMSRNDADELLRILRTLKLRRAPMKRLLDQALDIALKHSLAVYDAGYISLAIHYSYPLVTLDQPQIRAALAEGVTLKSVADFQS